MIQIEIAPQIGTYKVDRDMRGVWSELYDIDSHNIVIDSVLNSTAISDLATDIVV